jgi:LPXTG-motif cell wall-anchored protein
VGFIKDQTGSTDAALYSLAGLIVVGSLVALRVTRSGALKAACAN